MQVNESSENYYLETILMLSKTHPVVRSVDIATELNFKKSSVSVAIEKAREKDACVFIVFLLRASLHSPKPEKKLQIVFMDVIPCFLPGSPSLG